MLDLHRHDHFSQFDGFNNSFELAKLAKQKGYTALGNSNHGNTSGLIKHYLDCKEQGVKPVLGVEAYFQPKFNKDKSIYHLCLFAKNLVGYENINKMLTVAARSSFYRKPIVTFSLLKKYNKGVICTTACIAGFIPQMLVKGDSKIAFKAARSFLNTFGNDFYIEIQPYRLHGQGGLQEALNLELIKLANRLEIKCILTSDSHYGNKDDFDTYLKMHEMSGKMSSTKYDIGATYGERYMPDLNDLAERFIKMHQKDFGKSKAAKLANQMYVNLEEIENKVSDDIFADLPLTLPEFSDNSVSLLKQEIINGLKRRGKYNNKYLKRCKQEFNIIVYHGFHNYFLIVQDYVRYAKRNNILVGPGRGSVCNSLVAYALGITEVDSIYFGLDFTRFLRKDKKTLPDIDLDFEVSRRAEVIQYIVNKYKNKAVRIGAYGSFKADNLINDLSKVCGVDDKSEIAEIKTFVKKYLEIDGNSFKIEEAKKDRMYSRYNKQYDNIIKHFSKLYGKFRYFGTHAGGVAITGGNILSYTSIRRYKDEFISAFDHFDIEKINAVKLDVLGLKALSELTELEQLTGKKYYFSWFEDKKVLDNFKVGNTIGIFQFESTSARSILKEIQADTMQDVIAANALNRPGPLSLGMPSQYAHNKVNVDDIKGSKYFEYTKETYGTVVYQEQITAICRGLGKLSWSDSDKVLKMMKSHGYKKDLEDEIERVRDLFVKGCMSNGLTKEEALDIHSKILTYAFNKGHATGYAMIAMIEMYYKVYYPVEFWYVKLKYAPTSNDLIRYKINSVKDGVVIFLPHVNQTAQYSIRKIDGGYVLQEGLMNIKNVGAKAAETIEQERIKNGPYKSYDDFVNRVPKRQVNSRVVSTLLEQGALEFNKKTYFNRVVKYNSTLYAKSLN